MEARAEPRPSFLARIVGIGPGASLVPLLILFGLNAVDELDRTAFSVLLPEIRDEFGLGLTGVTSLSAAVIPAGLLVALPVARLADRGRRTRIAVFGAATWAVFSILTGLAPTLVVLGLARVGSGLGRAVNHPVHTSLLSDYYEPSARTKVISAHRSANTIGAFFGPLIAGFVAGAVGWRIPFYILAAPTLVLITVTLVTLHEPARTGTVVVEGRVRFRDAFRTLWGIRTLRRLWMTFPFLAFVAIGLQPLLALYYSDVFDVDAGPRGVIQAFDAPFIVFGLLVGSRIMDRYIAADAGRALSLIALAASAIGVFILGAAWAPRLWIGIACAYAVQVLATVLLSGGISIVSLVSPAESRASAFALFEIFALVGVVALPIVGLVGDAYGIRVGMAILAPVLFVGSVLVATAGRFVNDDIARVYPEHVPKPAGTELTDTL